MAILVSEFLNETNSAYLADSDKARQVFGLDTVFPTNHPRVAWEYYVRINLDDSALAHDYFRKYFTGDQYEQFQVLVKSVDMPSMKIDTVGMNQYNRKRLTQ